MKKLILIFAVFIGLQTQAQSYILKEYKTWSTTETMITDDTITYNVEWWCIRETANLNSKTLKFIYRQDKYVDDTVLIAASSTFPKHKTIAWKQDDWLLINGVTYTQDTVFYLMRFGDWKANRKAIGRRLIKGKLKSPPVE